MLRVHSLCVPSISRAFLHTQPRAFPLGFLVGSVLRSLCIHNGTPHVFSRSLHHASPCEFPLTFPVHLMWVPPGGSPMPYLVRYSGIHCANRVIHLGSPCVPRAFPRVFGSCCFMFSNEFLNGCPVGPCNICRAFLVFDTARFLRAQWYISLYITLQVSCSFHVPFLPFSVLRFMFFLPSPVRSDIRNSCALSRFPSGFPPTYAYVSLAL